MESANLHAMPKAPPRDPLWEAPPRDPLWKARQLRKHIQLLLDRLRLLKSLSLELELIADIRANGAPPEGQERLRLFRLLSGKDLNAAEAVALDAAREVQLAVQELLIPLQQAENAGASHLRDKRSKLLRNRKRRRKKAREAAEYRSKAEDRLQEFEKKTDEWLSREQAKDMARRQMESMQKLAEKKAKEERQKLEKELEMSLVIEKLHELRSLRVQKLKKQGCFFPDEDNEFMERVRVAAAEEDERKVVNGGNSSPLRFSAENTAEKSVALSSERATPFSSSKRSRSGFDVHRYYYGATMDMSSLVEVRKQWDTYISTFGGSRIPGHWVQPPPPSNEIWASYLVVKDAPQQIP